MICYLVRHGKDDETVRGGWSEHSLVPEGDAQVHSLGKEMLGKKLEIGCIYSSDLTRAKETAQILAGYLGCPVEYDSRFREANNGKLAGMKHALADAKYPGVYWSALDYREHYPDGESPEQFFNRIQAAWSEFKALVLKNSAKDVLLVTHGGVVEAVLCIENHVTFSNKERHFRTPNAKLIPVEIK